MDSLKTTSFKSTPMALVAIVVILTAVSYAESIVNPLLMALFMATILVQPIKWMIKKRLPRWLAILIAILGLLALYVAFFQLLATSWSRFLQDAPKYEQNLQNLSQSTLKLLSERGIDLSAVGESSPLAPSRIMQYTAVVVGKLSAMVSKEITFLLLTIFLLAEFDSVLIKAEALIKGTTVSAQYLKSIGDSIRHYLSIKTITSLITGVLVGIGLALVGVDYPGLWGLIAFLLNYIPNIGSIIAAIPALAFALIQLGFGGALWTAGIFIVVNMIIGNAVEPRMMGKGLGLSTFVVFFALIFWGFILGPIGMFLSVPLTMVLKLIMERNPETRWIAVLLGTEDEVRRKLGEEDENGS